MPLALIVEMHVRPGRSTALLPLLVENARRSVADEPGCRRFDVLLPAEGADRVVLYEIYDDEAAFDAHRITAHYIEFRAAARDLITETVVQRFSVAN
jgi:autoinducer 2-degrading protein